MPLVSFSSSTVLNNVSIGSHAIRATVATGSNNQTSLRILERRYAVYNYM